MHAIFHNPSLLAEILLHNPKYFNRSAALACKAFLSPALDSIWEELGIFWYPVKLLKLVNGVQVCTYFENGTKWESLSIARPLTASDLCILKSYSRRVRNIIYHFDNHFIQPPPTPTRVEPSFFANILTILQDEPLFPRLKELHFCPTLGTPRHIEALHALSLYLPALRSPMLETFHFQVMREANIWPSLSLFFHHMLKLPMQRVKAITLAMPPVPRLLETMIMFRSLERLTMELQVIDPVECQQLSCLEHLRYLSLGFVDDTPTRQPPNHVVTPATLQNVKVLHLTTMSTLTPINDFFSLLLFPSLDGLGLTYERRPFASENSYEWEEHFSILVEHLPNLRTLHLSPCDDSFNEKTLFPFSTFSPLLKLNLDKASIHEPCMAKIGNGEFLKLAKAWPNLTSLSLGLGSAENDAADHDSLVTVSQYLPNLKSLDVPINLLGPSPPLPDDLIPHDRLCTLDLGRLIYTPPNLFPLPPNGLSDIRELAIFLNALFPSLVSIGTYRSLDGTSADEDLGLDIMSELLNCVRDTRDAERKRIGFEKCSRHNTIC